METEPTKATAHDLSEPFSWHAPETRGPVRGLGWYLSFAVVIMVLMALSVFWIKSWTFTVLIPIMAVALLSLSTKTPRMINYAISPKVFMWRTSYTILVNSKLSVLSNIKVNSQYYYFPLNVSHRG